MKLNFWTVLGISVLAGVIVTQFVSREDLERLRDQAQDYLRQAGDQAKDWAQRNNIGKNGGDNPMSQFDSAASSGRTMGSSESYA